MKTSIEAMNQAAKGCGDCFLQDCDWPSCVPKVKEAIKREEAQGVEPTEFEQWLNSQRGMRVSEVFHEIVARVTSPAPASK